MTEHSRKSSTALQWHPHQVASEITVIDVANARQVALRIRLRNHYWLTDCKPMSPVTVALIQKKMTMISADDKMTESEVTELLTDHYGFLETPEGLTIPELDHHQKVAIAASEARADRAGNGGRAKAEKAKAALLETPVKAAHDF